MRREAGGIDESREEARGDEIVGEGALRRNEEGKRGRGHKGLKRGTSVWDSTAARHTELVSVRKEEMGREC